jgi:hypothetical protein
VTTTSRRSRGAARWRGHRSPRPTSTSCSALVEREAVHREVAGHVLDAVELRVLIGVGGVLPRAGPLEGHMPCPAATPTSPPSTTSAASTRGTTGCATTPQTQARWRGGCSARSAAARKSTRAATVALTTAVGARKSAYVMHPADTRGVGRRGGRAVGSCGSRLARNGGVVGRAQPDPRRGVADGSCNGVRTR